MVYSQPFDVAIVGGGIAGLSVALRLPEHLKVALFTKGQLGESNTRYAQGGLAVALGTDDYPELHFQDTIAAGAGLCDEAAVRVLVEQAPAAVRWLMQVGVQFDRAQPGHEGHATVDGLLLGREAAHSRWRILHAGGDATGAEIERALMAAVLNRSSVTLFEECYVYDLFMQDGACAGVQYIDRDRQQVTLYTRATVLANGGAGSLWLRTSNPAGATADGIALAWRAGAAVKDLEFMQFHPTVLVVDGTSHLISEAVRGEGAYLRNHAGERFMPRYHAEAELAPRDVVARAILSEMLAENTTYQYLDLRHLSAQKMHARFPTISAICRQYGLDLANDLLPIAPAAHYCMGGVMVDTQGRTTVPHLYAVGEVACTGVHGANRLASNSLLEGLVFGLQIADHFARGANKDESWSCGCSFESAHVYDDSLPPPVSSSIQVDEHTIKQVRGELRQVMWRLVSLRREHAGLLEARMRIQALRRRFVAAAMHMPESVWPRWLETGNMLLVAELVIAAALERCESRGSHWRSDYPHADEALVKQHYVLQRLNSDCHEFSQAHEEVLPHA